MSVTSHLRVLSHGIDTLELWFSWGQSYKLPESFLERLEVARDELKRDPSRGPVMDVGRLCLPNPHQAASKPGLFGVFERARYRNVRHYSYALVFGDEALIVSFAAPTRGNRRDGQNQIAVTINARYIRELNWNVSEIVSTLQSSLSSLVGHDADSCRVSRVDLRADLGSLKPLFVLEDINRFVSQARIRRPFVAGVEDESVTQVGDPERSDGPPLGHTGDGVYTAGGVLPFAPGAFDHIDAALDGRRWSGFRFGSGDLLARCYSKTVQASRQSHAKDYLSSIDLREGEQVTRLEFQLRSGVLSHFALDDEMLDLRDWNVLEVHLSALWEYLTRWLSFRTPTENDSNVRRWDLDPVWIAYRSAWDAPETDLRRVNAAPSAQVSQLLAQGVGCLISVAAILAHDVREITLPFALSNLLEHHFRLSYEFLPKPITSNWVDTFSNRLVKFAGI
jgi:hypothetical protein